MCSENMIKIDILGNNISAPSGYHLTSVSKDYNLINLNSTKIISVAHKDLDDTNQTIGYEFFYRNMFFQKVMITVEIEKLNNTERKQQFLHFHKLDITKFNKNQQCIFKIDKYGIFYMNKIYKQEENNTIVLLTIAPNHNDLVKHFSLNLGCQTKGKGVR